MKTMKAAGRKEWKAQKKTKKNRNYTNWYVEMIANRLALPKKELKIGVKRLFLFIEDFYSQQFWTTETIHVKPSKCQPFNSGDI